MLLIFAIAAGILEIAFLQFVLALGVRLQRVEQRLQPGPTARSNAVGRQDPG